MPTFRKSKKKIQHITLCTISLTRNNNVIKKIQSPLHLKIVISYLIKITLLVSFDKDKTLYMVESKSRNYVQLSSHRVQVNVLLHKAKSWMPFTSNLQPKVAHDDKKRIKRASVWEIMKTNKNNQWNCYSKLPCIWLSRWSDPQQKE